LDFRFLQAMHAVLTHLRFWLEGSAPRRGFFLGFGAGRAAVLGPVPTEVLGPEEALASSVRGLETTDDRNC
jgi:hypothetical protein